MFELLAEVEARVNAAISFKVKPGACHFLIVTLKNCNIFYGLDEWWPFVAAHSNSRRSRTEIDLFKCSVPGRMRKDSAVRRDKAMFDGNWNSVFVGP